MKIIHCDADCFFAAIEMRDNPSLRGRPMAVGGDADRRGVISTCNYEARKFGIHSAMASAVAKRICPQLIIVPHRMEKYREASIAIRNIFYDYTSKVEPLSLDEAYLDVSMSDHFQGSATLIATEIRKRVFDEINITVSAGVAPNKFIAKIASDWNKPNGLYVVTPNRVDEFVLALPVSKIYGVGKVTSEKMQRLGIHTCKDLRTLNVFELTRHFGRFGQQLYDLCRGKDNRQVKPTRRRKSLSIEHTYPEDLPSLQTCLDNLPRLLQQFNVRLQRLDNDYQITKAFIKLKFNDFTVTTLERMIREPGLIHYHDMLTEAFNRKNLPVRLSGAGVRFEEFGDKSGVEQPDLFKALNVSTIGYD